MVNRRLVIVANWKTYRSYQQTITWCLQHQLLINALGSKNNQLIICPNVTSLSAIVPLFKESNIFFGGQTCSAYQSGAHTGDIDALSLYELGCTYCIVGHTERRTNNHETTQDIALQTIQLLSHGITPIVCVGESASEKEQGLTNKAIEVQLAPIFKLCQQQSIPVKKVLMIAYEPTWAIGSNQTPTPHDIQAVFEEIKIITQRYALTDNVRLLYGGSVNESNAHTLSQIPLLDGFLVGRASLELEALTKMLSI